MTLREFEPPFSADGRVSTDLRERGFAIARPEFVSSLAATPLAQLRALGGAWEALPSDPHLLDAGHYRRRRHGSFIVTGTQCRRVPHRAHFQARQYNALHGGMLRWFEPITDVLAGQPAWTQLLCGLGSLLDDVSAGGSWFVEAHQFRIHTEDGMGRPTPEGAHRDGVDFAALLLMARRRIRGGETRVFAAHEPTGQRFTLTEPLSLMLLDDARVVHESTPILPEQPGPQGRPGYRDTLVLTFRRGGFQEP